MPYVRVTQKKYFFSSITDWVRWNYLDGKVDYTEGVNAFTLSELNATVVKFTNDGQQVSAITAINNTDLWAKCKVIIWQDSDILDDTVSLNWQAPINDDKPRFICNRCDASKVEGVSRFAFSNYNTTNLNWGKRIPLMFSEGDNPMPCWGKSGLRDTQNGIVMPNIDSNHLGVVGNTNVYRNNQGSNMADVQIDCSSKGNFSIEIGADGSGTGGIYKLWNIDRSCTIYLNDGNTREHYIWIFNNGLIPTTTTKTLTIGSTNLALLTDEDKKIATDKGWTLA